MIIKNIEAKIRLASFVAAGSFITSIILALIVCFFAFNQVSKAGKTIYVFSNGEALKATATDMQTNRPAEYRAVIDQFHSLFFSLTPDDKYIEYQMKKAMYLVDASGVEMYNDLKENGYFNSILSSSSVITLQTDSIFLDVPRKYFRYYGKEKIDRRSSTVTRSLITEGNLVDIKRSDNNSNGVLITNWKTLENKDLENVPKTTF